MGWIETFSFWAEDDEKKVIVLYRTDGQVSFFIEKGKNATTVYETHIDKDQKEGLEYVKGMFDTYHDDFIKRPKKWIKRISDEWKKNNVTGSPKIGSR